MVATYRSPWSIRMSTTVMCPAKYKVGDMFIVFVPYASRGDAERACPPDFQFGYFGAMPPEVTQVVCPLEGDYATFARVLTNCEPVGWTFIQPVDPRPIVSIGLQMSETN